MEAEMRRVSGRGAGGGGGGGAPALTGKSVIRYPHAVLVVPNVPPQGNRGILCVPHGLRQLQDGGTLGWGQQVTKKEGAGDVGNVYSFHATITPLLELDGPWSCCEHRQIPPHASGLSRQHLEVLPFFEALHCATAGLVEIF